MLINNHFDAKKGKNKRYLNLEDIFGFCKIFKIVTKNLGFHLVFKTTELQNIIYTSMADDIYVTIKNFHLYIPNLIPSVETQVMFNEATQNNYKISYDEYYTERRLIPEMITKADIGSSQQLNSPVNLNGSHQTRTGADNAAQNINIAIFDNLDLRKYYVEIDGQRYPRDSSLMIYEKTVILNNTDI